jgi:hypothetical protein
MFFNKIQLILIKKNLKNRLTNVSHNGSGSSVKKVGVILDEKYLNFKEKIQNSLIKNSILEKNIKFIVFTNSQKKEDRAVEDRFSINDFNSNATINSSRLNWFLDEKFDLLINYYDENNPIMMLLTQITSSNFKVGFAHIDKRLNHLLIQTKATEQSVFMDETIKYLQILKKI